MTGGMTLAVLLALLVPSQSEQLPSTGPPASPSPAVPADPARTNTIRWVVGKGSTPFAYEVFRSEREDGPFVKINRELIAGQLASRSERVKSFEFVDSEIDLTKDYWYYVDTLNLMGVRERLTPTRKAPAKSGPRPTPTPTATPR